MHLVYQRLANYRWPNRNYQVLHLLKLFVIASFQQNIHYRLMFVHCSPTTAAIHCCCPDQSLSGGAAAVVVVAVAEVVQNFVIGCVIADVVAVAADAVE